MTILLLSEIPSFAKKVYEDSRELKKILKYLLYLHSEPKQFKTFIDLFNVDENVVQEFVNDPSILVSVLDQNNEGNIKYILSLLPNKTARMKLLIAPIGGNENKTILT
eukprot:3778_1